MCPLKAHRTIIACIERAPFCNLTLLRAYNAGLRLFRGPYRAKTYFGLTMVCDPYDLVQQIVLHFGVWEPNTSAVIEGLLEPGDVCVDVGANVGYDTLLASHLVGSQGAVVAIEASEGIFDLLSRNIRENDVSNIRLVRVAVSDRSATLDLYAGPPSNRGRTTTLPSKKLSHEGKVDALPLDEILTGPERSRLRLIKMDIEGAEAPVMRRFLETTELYPEWVNLIVEVAPSAEWPEIFERMRSAGFSAYQIENSYSREWYLKHRHELTPLQPIAAAPKAQSDILFTKGPAPLIRPLGQRLQPPDGA